MGLNSGEVVVGRIGGMEFQLVWKSDQCFNHGPRKGHSLEGARNVRAETLRDAVLRHRRQKGRGTCPECFKGRLRSSQAAHPASVKRRPSSSRAKARRW